MNQSVVKINKNKKIDIRINQEEYNVLEKICPNNISMAARQLIRDYAIKNNIKLTLNKPK